MNGVNLFRSFAPTVYPLTPHTANDFIFRLKPFVIFILCECEKDEPWARAASELRVLLERGKQRLRGLRNLQLLYVDRDSGEALDIHATYGLPLGHPALVIDNIPLG